MKSLKNLVWRIKTLLERMKRMMNTTRRERIHSQNRSLAHSIKEEAEQ